MGMKKGHKRWAALLLAMILAANLLFNNVTLLSVFAEDAAPEATTSQKEEKQEKKEELKEEDKKEDKDDSKNKGDAPENNTESSFKVNKDQKQESPEANTGRKTSDDNDKNKDYKNDQARNRDGNNDNDENGEPQNGQDDQIIPSSKITVNSISGAGINVGKQSPGTSYNAQGTVPEADATINVSFGEQSTAISGLYEVNNAERTVTVKLSAASGDQFNLYTFYKISGVTSGWQGIPDNNIITLPADGKYTLQYGYMVTDDSKKIESGTADITVDNAPPVFDDMSVEGWKDDTFSFKVPVSDANGLKKLTFSKDSETEEHEINVSNPVLSSDNIAEGTHTYTFTATDNYDNQASGQVQIKKDSSVPTITVNPTRNDNAEEPWYGGESRFEISVTNGSNLVNDNSGITEVTVNDIAIPLTKSEGTYTGEFTPNVGSGKDNVIIAKTGAGKTSEKTVNLSFDNRPIDTSVFVKYYINDVDRTENVANQNQNTVNKSSMVQMKLYIKDDFTDTGDLNDISGPLESYTISGITFTKGEGTTEDGAFEYTAATKIKASKINATINALNSGITLRDKAGNTSEAVTITPSDDFLAIYDTQRPVLTSVDLGTWREDFGAFFAPLNGSVTPEFTVTEGLSYYNNKENQTTNHTYSTVPATGGATGQATENGGVFTADTALAGEADKERPYTVNFSYVDGSDNPLEKTDDSIKGTIDANGKYTAKVVVDNKAPDNLTITSGSQLEQIGENENAVYYLKSDNDASKPMEFTISFTELYMDKAGVTLVALNKETENETRIPVTIDSLNENGEYTLTTEFADEGKYTFAVEAKDITGNTSTAKFGKTVVIDHTAPKLSVTHTAANKATFEVQDHKLYTYDYAVTYSIDDKWYDAGQVEVKNGDITADGNTTAWTYGKEDGKKDGTYSYTISYTDYAGNDMILDTGDGKGETGNADKPDSPLITGTMSGGKYASPAIIIDQTAPVIDSFSIDPASNRTVEGVKDAKDRYIYLNQDETNATISYTFTENNLDHATVILTCNEAGSVKPATTKSGDNSFNNQCNIKTWEADGDYTFSLAAADKAGNELDLSSADESNNNADAKQKLEKTYFVVDTKAPELKVEISKATSTLANSLRKGHTGKHELFYTAEPDIKITLKEHNYISGTSDVKYAFASALTDNSEWDQSNMATLAMTAEAEDEFSYKVAVPQENSHNYFTIEYTDFSGNKAVLIDPMTGDYEGDFNEETAHFISPMITRDNTKPIVKTTFNATPTYPNQDSSADRNPSTRYYYQKKLTMTIVVTEENFIPNSKNGDKSYKDGQIEYSVYDFDKDTENEIDNDEITWENDYTFKDGKKQYKGTVKFTEEWNYKIKTSVNDRCGYESSRNDNVTIDNTVPFISIEDKENTNNSDITFHKGNSGSLADFFDYKLFGYFHKDFMTVHITVHDMTSGVYKLKSVVTHEDGTVTEKEWDYAKLSGKPAGSEEATITILANAKDKIKVTPIDYAQVTGTSVNPRGGISETQAYHNSNSALTIKLNTKPSNTVGKLKYFKTAVNATITMADGHAGIKSYEYKAGTAVSGSHNYGNDAGTKDKKGAPTTAISYKEVFNPTMAAGDTNYTNKANPTVINASFTDNVGHTSKAEEKIVIDNKAPVIKVTWNPATGMNGKYYKETRTATITVNERNFNDAGVKWKINNMTGVQFSGWSHNGDTNTCTVAFTKDGDDFILDFDITDYAMNSASCPKQEPFTIDKTAPVISITFDKNNGMNGNYFNQTRVATLHVQEHNFRPEEVKETVSAKLDGKGISSPGTGGWSMGGDSHSASKTYDYDGDFELNFTCTDMAGNPANTIQTERFTIDKTKPVVKIEKVSERHAYNGKVTPMVTYSDVNLDKNQLAIKLIGNKVGNTANSNNYARDSRLIHNGEVIEWKDFKRIAEVDDIYTCEVVAKDKAGNTNEPAKVTFSVNRFGSNYIFGAETQELLSKDHPYTNAEIPIEVTEVNVNTLKQKEVSVQDENNNIRNLEENKDYIVREGSDKYQWKEYSYVINKENFSNEGRYNVTLSSVDRAENKMNNITKKKEIEFVIDKTKPTATISGLEESRYMENEHNIVLRASDNYGLKEGELYIDDQKKDTYDEQELTSPSGVTATLLSKNEPQRVSMLVRDWAGNEDIVVPGEHDDVIITTNLFWQWFFNKPLFYGSLVGTTAAVLGIAGVLTKGFGFSAGMAAQTGFWWMIFGQRRREEDDDK